MKMPNNKRVSLILNEDVIKSKKVDLILKADLGTWTPSGMSGTGAAPKGYKPGTEETAGKKEVVGESSAKPAVKVSKEVKAARTKVMPESVMTSAKPIPPATPPSAKKALDEAVKALDEAVKASKQYGGGMGQIKVRGNVAEYSGSAAKAPISSKPSSLGSGPSSSIRGQGVSDDPSKVKKLAQETGAGHFLSGSKEAKKSVEKSEGEPFGKPMYQRKDESTDDFRSRIIRHLIDDKGYAQNRAVAAAYDMSERGGTKKAIDDMLEATKRLRKAQTILSPHYPENKGNRTASVVTDKFGTSLHHYDDGTVRHPETGEVHGTWKHDKGDVKKEGYMIYNSKKSGSIFEGGSPEARKHSKDFKIHLSEGKKEVKKSMRKALTGASVPNLSRIRIIGSQEDTYRSATTPVSRATTVLNVDACPLTPDPNVVPKNEMAVIKSCNCCGRIYKSTTCPTCDINRSYIYKK
jgi:hypothetical protein